MDVASRVTGARAPLPAAAEAHRYAFAAALAEGRTVMHVGPRDAAAPLEGTAAKVRTRERLDLEAARGCDLVVWLDGLQHQTDLGETARMLEGLAGRGVGLLVCVPNATVEAPERPGPAAAWTAKAVQDLADRLDGAVVLGQFLAEGSLIVQGGSDGELTCEAIDDDEPDLAYANRLLLLADPGREAGAGAQARMQLAVAPNFNRWMVETERANRELRAANAALAREHLGRADSAAGAVVGKLELRVKDAERESEQRRREAEEWRAEAERQHRRASEAEVETEILRQRLDTLRSRKIVRAALGVARLNPRTWGGR